MKVTPTLLPEVVLIEPDVFADGRGFFLETWQQQRYRHVSVNLEFVQDNVSYSQQHTLRGLHVQHPYAQGKLIYVLQGEIFDVAVDIRANSPRFGQWCGHYLSAQNHYQLYIPPGFAHGFCVVSEQALVAYKCTELYHPETELTIAWDDPDLQINWPLSRAPTLSAKDRTGLKLKDISVHKLPYYELDL